MSDETEDLKKTSRKWIVTVWAMIAGTAIIIFTGVCSIMGKVVPESFGKLSLLLFSTAIAYIGGNVWQKRIFHKSEGEDK